MPVHHTAWWSEKLHDAHITVKYWRVTLSLEKRRQEDDELLERIKQSIRDDYDIYQGDRSRITSGQLCRAKKERKNCRNNSFKL
eukprot:11247992-Ditylum_brightwellii.AAC.1